MTENTNSNSPRTQDDTKINRNDYEKALDLAESGKYSEAITKIQQHLISAPNDEEALNDAGAILHCMGRSEDAIDHFIRARSLSDSAEIIWNLSETYLATGKAEQAIELFEDMDRMGILNADVLNRVADVLLNNNNPADALDILNRSLEMSPDQEILHPMIEVIRHKIAENEVESKP